MPSIDACHTAYRALLVLLAATGATAYGILGLLLRRPRRSTSLREHKAGRGTPLARVVANCEARWLLEDLQTALQGDAPAMQRVGGLLAAGCGVRGHDPEEAEAWVQTAMALQSYKEPALRPGLPQTAAQHTAGTGRYAAQPGAWVDRGDTCGGSDSEPSSEDEEDAEEDEAQEPAAGFSGRGGLSGGGSLASGRGSGAAGLLKRSRSWSQAAGGGLGVVSLGLGHTAVGIPRPQTEAAALQVQAIPSAGGAQAQAQGPAQQARRMAVLRGRRRLSLCEQELG
ncbi:hypothetical protein HYH03_007238 [Edaphochlamys debaryana]|uniref:Uncharacterized protein n=1 Tax=Edaphochlamys debaryana TaxID=47281 RepID=A0A836C0Q8_9CHLO|nr:hypothetical protein HYH03_007238 [Edaphochlamys debaryana]|eukprot:KAG2494724.1 hypothetical protein HYH03_007238 [Edaphochlamys debaryana]